MGSCFSQPKIYNNEPYIIYILPGQTPIQYLPPVIPSAPPAIPSAPPAIPSAAHAYPIPSAPPYISF